MRIQVFHYRPAREKNLIKSRSLPFEAFLSTQEFTKRVFLNSEVARIVKNLAAIGREVRVIKNSDGTLTILQK